VRGFGDLVSSLSPAWIPQYEEAQIESGSVDGVLLVAVTPHGTCRTD